VGGDERAGEDGRGGEGGAEGRHGWECWLVGFLLKEVLVWFWVLLG
jgi:hypothetical protein